MALLPSGSNRRRSSKTCATRWPNITSAPVGGTDGIIRAKSASLRSSVAACVGYSARSTACAAAATAGRLFAGPPAVRGSPVYGALLPAAVTYASYIATWTIPIARELNVGPGWSGIPGGRVGSVGFVGFGFEKSRRSVSIATSFQNKIASIGELQLARKWACSPAGHPRRSAARDNGGGITLFG